MKASRRSRCFVEIRNGLAYRIMRHVDWSPDAPPPVELPRIVAVEQIRRQVFSRCGGRCELCGRRVEWSGYNKGDMHERVPRGQGGEVSVDNSIYICQKCHRGKDGVHANHFPQWTKKD